MRITKALKISTEVIALWSVCLGLLTMRAVAQEATTFEPTWESLAQYECPDWFRDAKFGLYAHWGPYSTTMAESGSDWYSHYMYEPGHAINVFHEKTYGPVEEFGYHRLIPRFTAEGFDPEAWAELFIASGARFAGPVAEHADGFAMWDSRLTPWNAMQMGPRRDVVGELEQAIRRRGLRFMTSLHHHWKWAWYPTDSEAVDVSTPHMRALYGPRVPAEAFLTATTRTPLEDIPPEHRPTEAFCNDWLAKTKEVIDSYKPDLLWFDNRMNILPERHRMEMASYFYNQAVRDGRSVVLNYKDTELRRGTAVLDLERSRMREIYADPWLCDMSIATNSWSYASKLEYYSTARLVHDLADIVSKNGCLLLNIAPAPDGTIPVEQEQRLRQIGMWLKVNGEAIYGTRPWMLYGEGPTEIPQGHLADLKLSGFTISDIRFTAKGNALYAIVLGWPGAGQTVQIKSLASAGNLKTVIQQVSIFGVKESVEWSRTRDALIVKIPVSMPKTEAVVFKISLAR